MTSFWDLRINNIGTFKGEHHFKLKSGLNIIGSPNATGKTSIINSLRLLVNSHNSSFLNRILNNSSLIGGVSLKNKEHNFFVNLSRTEDKVIVNGNNPFVQSDQIDEIAFLSAENPFFIAVEREASQQKIKEWLFNITDLEYYEKAFIINAKNKST